MTTRARLLPLVLTVAVVLLDRITKVIVTSTMRLHETIPFLGDVVRWTYIHNDGMVWGIDVPRFTILRVISIVAVVVVVAVYWHVSREPGATRWIMAAILGGAIGNSYDRIRFGYVIDFVDVDMPNWIMQRWPVFNVADAAVSVGVVLLMLLLLLRREPDDEQPAERHDLESGAIRASLDDDDAEDRPPEMTDREGA